MLNLIADEFQYHLKVKTNTLSDVNVRSAQFNPIKIIVLLIIFIEGHFNYNII